MPVYEVNVKGESNSALLRVGFDRRLKLQFHGTKLSSDGGLLLFRELDDALGLSQMASWELRDKRTGNVHSADNWQDVLEPVIKRYRWAGLWRKYLRADAAFAIPKLFDYLEAHEFG